MIDIFKAIIIGIVEGLTEFLPISSTGHIDLVQSLIHMGQSQQFKDMFNYVIQLGAIMAVVILYFNKLNPLAPSKEPAEKRSTWLLWAKVIVAVLPSVLIGLPLNDFMDEHLQTPPVIATTLILYGILFIVIERWNDKRKPVINSLADVSFQLALCIGLFQALSIVPGTSRSGATILGAIILGTSRYVATEFSFFLAIPTMFGVSILKLGKFFMQGNSFTGEQFAVLAVGFIVSWVVAWLTIKWLLRFVQGHDFQGFGWYRIALGIVVILVMVL
ncbi:undecaprenyl-diphosphate phosphatase [Lacticaseibacillus pantheris]|jgi:undecaprenyl-diphosphatase|uniref:Undecaprenyl-diphosphatase n=1 Tax=Lacticaseibacillus pantheris DSM 15945 = JCM 12539 = NBRC 106106 TaxID=1423783 RepID=A0A0R1U9N0_9LACO|nr:undecaprenyl-diphosphate phosphatase [Lacticaseibacillus pantheris]KRL87554.1 undecaprenyl-diphosphatase [Lacticaseibacillus pantheris DSM 15945 = JCM 12539 = NBRC 106106]WKF85041.1 undecaprenyl-diphosphate phosphatase [Lacticaseibacillus pantheris]